MPPAKGVRLTDTTEGRGPRAALGVGTRGGAAVRNAPPTPCEPVLRIPPGTTRAGAGAGAVGAARVPEVPVALTAADAPVPGRPGRSGRRTRRWRAGAGGGRGVRGSDAR